MDDSEYGILLYWTESPGIGGRIRQQPEDFVVEEIPLKLPEGDSHAAFLIEKRDLDTFAALRRISRKLGTDPEDIGYAGLKDKRAVTRQWMTVPGSREIEGMDVPGIKILETKAVGDGLYRGDLRGNRFRITVRGTGLGEEELEARMESLTGEMEEGIPNFYGPQRFGKRRPVTHRVGREMVKGNFQEAVDLYLTFPGEEGEEVSQARERLREGREYGEALDYLPSGLRYERILLEEMAGSGDPVAALRRFPESLRQLFVAAYQSWIFNLSLSRFLEGEGETDNFPVPVIGHKTRLGEGGFDDIVRDVLEEEDVIPEDFLLEDMPEVSQKGTVRAAMMSPEISYEISGEDVAIGFSLRRGRYATVVLREITKN